MIVSSPSNKWTYVSYLNTEIETGSDLFGQSLIEETPRNWQRARYQHSMICSWPLLSSGATFSLMEIKHIWICSQGHAGNIANVNAIAVTSNMPPKLRRGGKIQHGRKQNWEQIARDRAFEWMDIATNSRAFAMKNNVQTDCSSKHHAK